jgi:hypothetical protein
MRTFLDAAKAHLILNEARAAWGLDGRTALPATYRTKPMGAGQAKLQNEPNLLKVENCATRSNA